MIVSRHDSRFAANPPWNRGTVADRNFIDSVGVCERQLLSNRIIRLTTEREPKSCADQLMWLLGCQHQQRASRAVRQFAIVKPILLTTELSTRLCLWCLVRTRWHENWPCARCVLVSAISNSSKWLSPCRTAVTALSLYAGSQKFLICFCFWDNFANFYVYRTATESARW